MLKQAKKLSPVTHFLITATTLSILLVPTLGNTAQDRDTKIEAAKEIVLPSGKRTVFSWAIDKTDSTRDTRWKLPYGELAFSCIMDEVHRMQPAQKELFFKKVRRVEIRKPKTLFGNPKERDDGDTPEAKMKHDTLVIQLQATPRGGYQRDGEFRQGEVERKTRGAQGRYKYYDGGAGSPDPDRAAAAQVANEDAKARKCAWGTIPHALDIVRDLVGGVSASGDYVMTDPTRLQSSTRDMVDYALQMDEPQPQAGTMTQSSDSGSAGVAN